MPDETERGEQLPGTMDRTKRFSHMRISNWMSLGLESWTLAAEASAVIALRLGRFTTWDARSQHEVLLMVSEKIGTALELQQRAITGQLGRTPYSAASACLVHYRKAVAANRRRLSRLRH